MKIQIQVFLAMLCASVGFSQQVNPVGKYITKGEKRYEYTLTVNADSTYKCVIVAVNAGVEESYWGSWSFSGNSLLLNSGEFEPYSVYKITQRRNTIVARPSRLYARYRLIKWSKWTLIKV